MRANQERDAAAVSLGPGIGEIEGTEKNWRGIDSACGSAVIDHKESTSSWMVKGRSSREHHGDAGYH